MTNEEKNKCKNLIMSAPYTHIRYKEKLVYDKQITTKSGKKLHRFINRDFKEIFLVSEDMTQLFKVMKIKDEIKIVNWESYVKFLEKTH